MEPDRLLVAGLTGLVSGLLLSIPVGPANLTILNEGARRGFARALFIGLGATTMEVIYCALAFTGFATFLQGPFVKAAIELASFVFLLFLGLKFLLAPTVVSPVHLTRATDRLEERIEERLRPHSAFMIGFVRVLANPGVLVFWIILAANFISRDWVPPSAAGRLACIAGVALGTGLWFVTLSYMVSLGHRKFSERTLLRMEHFSGIVLLVVAVAHGINIAWQMAHHRLTFGP